MDADAHDYSASITHDALPPRRGMKTAAGLTQARNEFLAVVDKLRAQIRG